MKKLLSNSIFQLSIFIVFVTLLAAWPHRTEIFTPTDRAATGKAYSQSQYVLGDEAIEKIDDGTLYQYAADAYFQGEDPTAINFEHPPLGKYVFGLSLQLFNRVLIINILLFALCLTLFATLLKTLKFSFFSILLAVGFLALGSGLGSHLRTVLLDLQILLWSLAFFNVLFLSKESWRKYSLIGLVLGLLMATKYFFPIIFLFVGLLGIWVWQKRTWKKAVFSLAIILLVYLASYAAFFIHQHSLMDFIRFEWFRFRWWTGNRTIPQFIILQTLFLGKYRAWWEPTRQYLPSGDWNLSWPILFVAYLISLIKQKLSLKTNIII
ncbi:MAG: hypothetical protein ABII10_01200, partial [Candidatus Paceibacterota bacterium]